MVQFLAGVADFSLHHPEWLWGPRALLQRYQGCHGWVYLIYLLPAIGLSPSGSTHLHTNNTQNNTNNNQTTQITNNVEECGLCLVLASFTPAFALQLRKKHGKTSVRVRKTSVSVQYTYYQNTHTLQNPHKHTHYKTHTYTHYRTIIHDTSWQRLGWIPPNAVNTVRCSWWWAKTSPETCRAD